MRLTSAEEGVKLALISVSEAWTSSLQWASSRRKLRASLRESRLRRLLTKGVRVKNFEEVLKATLVKRTHDCFLRHSPLLELSEGERGLLDDFIDELVGWECSVSYAG